MDPTSYTTIVTIAFTIFHDAAHINMDVLIIVFFGTISTLRRNDFIAQSLHSSKDWMAT